MSFSVKTKNELARLIPLNPCCQLAELSALVRMDGTIQLSTGQKLSLQISTENAGVARKIFKLMKQLFDVSGQIIVQRKTRLKKNNVYLVEILPQPVVRNILEQLGIMDYMYNMGSSNKPDLVKKRCCIKGYLRGAFLGGGSVNSPEGTYHLEIITSDQAHGEAIKDLMAKLDVQAKVSKRKNWWIVYIKGSEQIVDFLNIIGAHKALLDFENVKIFKEMRNKVNRLVNCETANLNKTVDAAIRQVENIRMVAKLIDMDKLSPGLRQVAQLRLEYPDVSLKELGELCEPEISKSAVNHRMRKLEKIALELKKNRG
ncbi:MAG: DNA-binding protein WhiA [Clostridia bacterium]|nr:DNA-binding protein WhiA [Clostridia bacterium]